MQLFNFNVCVHVHGIGIGSDNNRLYNKHPDLTVYLLVHQLTSLIISGNSLIHTIGASI